MIQLTFEFCSYNIGIPFDIVCQSVEFILGSLVKTETKHIETFIKPGMTDEEPSCHPTNHGGFPSIKYWHKDLIMSLGNCPVAILPSSQHTQHWPVVSLLGDEFYIVDFYRQTNESHPVVPHSRMAIVIKSCGTLHWRFLVFARS